MHVPEGFEWYPAASGVDLRRGGADGRVYAAIRPSGPGTFAASVMTPSGYVEVRNTRCASEEEARALIVRWLHDALAVHRRRGHGPAGQ